MKVIFFSYMTRSTDLILTWPRLEMICVGLPVHMEIDSALGHAIRPLEVLTPPKDELLREAARALEDRSVKSDITARAQSPTLVREGVVWIAVNPVPQTPIPLYKIANVSNIRCLEEVHIRTSIHAGLSKPDTHDIRTNVKWPSMLAQEAWGDSQITIQ
jgi:hypothetical protein